VRHWYTGVLRLFQVFHPKVAAPTPEWRELEQPAVSGELSLTPTRWAKRPSESAA